MPRRPDIYQGNELWNLSLVDPDNRRQVDYGRGQQMFQSLRKAGSDPTPATLSSLLETPEDGRIKLYLTWRALCLRQQQPELFQEGEYVPLTVQGARADHVVAFARKSKTSTVLVVVPRLVAGLLNDNDDVPPIGSRIWGDTHILIPFCSCSQKYQNVVTGEVLDANESGVQKREDYETIAVSDLLARFPVALCLLG